MQLNGYLSINRILWKFSTCFVERISATLTMSQKPVYFAVDLNRIEMFDKHTNSPNWDENSARVIWLCIWILLECCGKYLSAGLLLLLLLLASNVVFVTKLSLIKVNCIAKCQWISLLTNSHGYFQNWCQISCNESKFVIHLPLRFNWIS